MAGTHKSNNTLFSSNISSPGYVESIASSNTKTKETLRTQELIPSEILENSGGVQVLLDAYYKYMNLQEFIYQETETYEDVILDNRAVFRVNDPRNENDHFFTDDDGANSTLTVRDSSGNITTLNLGELNVSITNGNNTNDNNLINISGCLLLKAILIPNSLLKTAFGTSPLLRVILLNTR